MTFRIIFSLCLLMASIQFQADAQDKVPIKFGHVTPADFDLSKLTVDTSGGGVIIAQTCYASFVGNDHGGLDISYEYKNRILITAANGVGLANVEVPLSISGEQMGGIKATTYNLENGNVVATKLNSSAIFEDKKTRNVMVKKFTLPEVKAGSIIEYSYNITSSFLFHIRPWEFQGRYPREWSEFEVDIPEYYQYVTFAQGYLPFFIKTESYSRNSYVLHDPEMITVSGNTTDKRWVMKDVPAVKEEKFITTIDNYISKIEFQLSGYKYPNSPYHDVMGSWATAAVELLKEDDFGDGINSNNGWLTDEMKNITAGATNDLDKARKIYYYVRDNIKSTGARTWWIDDNKSLHTIFKNKSGSVGEINLLLVAMLRHEGIAADPVILSTRDNGDPQPFYPLTSKYNYLICKTDVDTMRIFLDATQPYLGFGRLPGYCYNGPARIIDNNATPIAFLTDRLKDEKTTSVMLFSDSVVSGKWSGTIESNLGYLESEKVRARIADKGLETYKKDEQLLSEDFAFSNIDVKKLKDSEFPLEVDCDVAVTPGDTGADVIYFSPILKNWYKENPLKSAERKFPVEMPSLTDDTYSLYMDVPAGYTVDELPKSARVTLNDDALFEYYITKDDANINMKVHLQFFKATFSPEEYQDLRGFFDYIVKKNSEQIVFKKKK